MMVFTIHMTWIVLFKNEIFLNLNINGGNLNVI
jgi:hypothetical protein